MLDEVRKRVWILVPPLIALWIACRGTPPRGIVREPIVQAIAVLAAAMELIIGPVAKEGSGAHHYLPFLPVVALLAADIGRRRGIASHHPVGHRYRGVGGLLLVTWILVMGLGAARTQERFRSYMATRTGIEVRFARTSRESFDAGAIMDREETGIPIPEAAREKMRSRPFDWIVNPPGGPFFSMNSLYPLLRNLGRKGTVRTGPMRPSRRAPRRETTAAVK